MMEPRLEGRGRYVVDWNENQDLDIESFTLPDLYAHESAWMGTKDVFCREIFRRSMDGTVYAYQNFQRKELCEES